MAETGAPGVVAAAGSTGEIAQETQKAAANTPQNAGGLANPQAMSGQGAQFVFVAATAANVLCDNLTQVQINLLANFLSVITTCVYAILTVENPTDIIEA